MSLNIDAHSTVFSVVPSRIASVCFFPVASTPIATTTVWSPKPIPSMNSATISSSPSGRFIHVSSSACVRATNRRLTALLLVPRASIAGGRSSSDRSYLRVETPIQHLLQSAFGERVLGREPRERGQLDLTPLAAFD